ncbi:hypothetical protein ACOMHN_057965 [Nucella lapillus]
MEHTPNDITDPEVSGELSTLFLFTKNGQSARLKLELSLSAPKRKDSGERKKIIPNRGLAKLETTHSDKSQIGLTSIPTSCQCSIMPSHGGYCWSFASQITCPLMLHQLISDNGLC